MADHSVRSSMRHLTQLVRQCLTDYGSVNIVGLGEFRKAGDGELRFIADRSTKVFVSYVVEDRRAALRLARDLAGRCFDAWIDQQRLIAGQNWPRAIKSAIQMADFFVPLFSKHSVLKPGQFQAELRYALDCTAARAPDERFVIPVRLEECRVPPEVASYIQYVDLFPDWDKGMTKLVRALRKRPPST